jgi:prepilin-type N-terminal cleavage/methylation domain-containing protein
MNKTNKKGFTLVELLVVISIISLLTTTVFASVNVAQEKARDAVRAEQIRQIISAFRQYHLDKGVYPGSDIGLTLQSNHCLGLNDGSACWGQGDFVPGPHYPTEPAGYAAAYGNTALTNALAPYMSSIPKDPLGTHDYGDYYMYIYGTGGDPNKHTLSWVIESCAPDVKPTSTPLVSPGTCRGGTISKLPLWYGYGCQYKCELDLEQ